MRQSNKGDEGIKIAQAAKDLNVTSVTIRRYITEFNIETTSDENGIKVLPEDSMEELQLIRKLKEDGLTNPQVLEKLEEHRSAPKSKKEKAEPKRGAKRAAEAKAEKAEAKKETRKPERRAARKVEPVVEEDEEEAEETEEEAVDEVPEIAAEAKEDAVEAGGDGRSKHSLTCQTCGKVFEHMNPRLRDCLDCYRAKRKERRRGAAERHKNVIQHPLAQQALSKKEQRQEERERGDRPERGERPERGDRADRMDRMDRMDRETFVGEPSNGTASFAAAPMTTPGTMRRSASSGVQQRPAVRSYRKAIEETRGITSNLKRRLERPDLPEGERRWLEQIYAYQLILHQGWRHLAEYKAGNQPQNKQQQQQESTSSRNADL